MRARDILSKNLRALIDEGKKTGTRPSSIRKIAEASGSKLSNGTVGRMALGSHTTDIDALADLAEVLGMQPWQLLVENLNPKALPRLADADFLSQLKQIVDVAQATKPGISPPPVDELMLQKEERTRSVDVGPALQEAFARGKKKNASRKSSAPPKHQGGRGR